MVVTNFLSKIFLLLQMGTFEQRVNIILDNIVYSTSLVGKIEMVELVLFRVPAPNIKVPLM